MLFRSQDPTPPVSELDGLLPLIRWPLLATECLASVEERHPSLASSSAPGAVNPEVAKVGALLREQVAMMVADFKAAEMWLYLKTPEVSDGNNFGVEVQAYVLGELKAMRTEAAAMMDAVSAYHLLRGATLEKIVKTPTKTTDDESKVEVDGDKTTTKSTKSTKSNASASASSPRMRGRPIRSMAPRRPAARGRLRKHRHHLHTAMNT